MLKIEIQSGNFKGTSEFKFKIRHFAPVPVKFNFRLMNS